MGSMFDNRKILHGLPKDGQKIEAITNKTNSWFLSVVEDTKKLKIGKEYTVLKTELNSSSSYVWLEEFGKDVFFNIHSFEWELPNLDPNDLIGFFVSDMNTIHHKYGWGVQVGENIRHEGNPMIVVKCENKEHVDYITSVEFKN
jgi:hypothetical protein